MSEDVQRLRLEYPVDVLWPSNHRQGTIKFSLEEAEPVVVMDGKVYSRTALPRGCRVLMVWPEPTCTGPAWAAVHRAMTTGQFPLQIVDDERDAERHYYEEVIAKLGSELAMKDNQVVDMSKRLSECELLTFNLQKKRWWQFWK